MKNNQLFMALIAISSIGSSAFAGAYTSINMGFSKSNKAFTKLAKAAEKEENEAKKESLLKGKKGGEQPIEEEILEKKSEDKAAQDDADKESFKGKSSARFCGDLRLGYDHDVTSSFKIGAFVGYGLGGGREQITHKTNGKETGKISYAVKSYMPIGLRFGYRITPDSTIFLSTGFARLALKGKGTGEFKDEFTKETRKMHVNAYFIGLGFETAIGSSKNVFLNAQIEVFKGKIKGKALDDFKKAPKFTQTNFTVGVTYRF